MQYFLYIVIIFSLPFITVVKGSPQYLTSIPKSFKVSAASNSSAQALQAETFTPASNNLVICCCISLFSAVNWAVSPQIIIVISSHQSFLILLYAYMLTIFLKVTGLPFVHRIYSLFSSLTIIPPYLIDSIN